MNAIAPIQQWEAPLPATPDYRMHKTFVIPPLKNNGTYLIVASARAGFPGADNRLFGIYLTVGDLVLVTRHEGVDAEVTVLYGSSGKAVTGAEVMLYRFDYNRRHQRIETKLSDERGIVQFHISQQNSQYFLVARKGAQVAFDPQHLYPYLQNQLADISSTLFFTDRSIYRPLQKLFWKAVLYKSSVNRSRFETSPTSTFIVTLKDINNQEVELGLVTPEYDFTTTAQGYDPRLSRALPRTSRRLNVPPTRQPGRRPRSSSQRQSPSTRNSFRAR